MTAGGGAQKLLENHAGAESMQFVVLASKIGLRTRLMSRVSLGLRRVVARVRGVAGHGACGRSLPCLWPQPPTARVIAGVDEDEEWWLGLVLGVHSQGAHTVASTTTASSSSNANRNP